MMRLETIRNVDTGAITVKGADFEVVVQQSGEVPIHFPGRAIQVGPKQELEGNSKQVSKGERTAKARGRESSSQKENAMTEAKN